MNCGIGAISFSSFERSNYIKYYLVEPEQQQKIRKKHREYKTRAKVDIY